MSSSEIRWTPITEQLPEQWRNVLFCHYDEEAAAFQDVKLGWFEGEWTKSSKSIVMETVPGQPGWWFPCTHWMPLPPTPAIPVEDISLPRSFYAEATDFWSTPCCGIWMSGDITENKTVCPYCDKVFKFD